MSAQPETMCSVGAPSDDLWIEARGHRWATNGHVLVREDGPFPDPQAPPLKAAKWVGIRPHLVEDLLGPLDHPTHGFPMVRVGRRPVEVMWEGNRDDDTFLAEVDPAYDACLTAEKVDEVRCAGPKAPLVAYRAGEVVAVVAQRGVP